MSHSELSQKSAYARFSSKSCRFSGSVAQRIPPRMWNALMSDLPGLRFAFDSSFDPSRISRDSFDADVVDAH
jgi:hypothetical protein